MKEHFFATSRRLIVTLVQACALVGLAFTPTTCMNTKTPQQRISGPKDDEVDEMVFRLTSKGL
jgi:hypothetical protein